MTDFNWDVEDDASEWDWNDPVPPKEPEPEPIFGSNTGQDFTSQMEDEQFITIWLAFVKKYENDRVSFATEVLKIELMEHQTEILRAVDKGKRRIAVKSGHRIGKTLLLAILALHHLVTKYPQKTIVTAPTAGQLFNALYPEIKSIGKKLPPFIYTLFDWQSENIKLKADPDGSFLSARTASPENGEAFQGIHSEFVLFIWDEAAGIDERLFNAAAGSMAAPNAIQILTGNPTKLNNNFHRAFTVNADLYEKFTVSSVGKKTVSPEFIQGIINEHGKDSNEYRVRVLGEFPDTEDESYISAASVRAAMVRGILTPPMAAVVYGVDPARQGDDRTVITRRRGLYVIEDQISLSRRNTMQVVGEIQRLALEDQNRLVEEFKAHGLPLAKLPPVPAAIAVDVIGIGAGVVDRLRELGYPVIEVNAAETSTSEPQARRERDALWKRAKAFLEAGKCRIPQDEQLAAELTGAHYEYDSSGVLKIESKKDMKKRIGRSPDKADSLMLALTVPSETITQFMRQGMAGNIGYGSGPSGALSKGNHSPTTRR